MFVKICGIKSIQDALMAAEAGADAIGLLVGQEFPSEDFIAMKLAGEIIMQVQMNTRIFVVTHYADPGRIQNLLNKTNTGFLQLHGAVSADTISLLKHRNEHLKIIKPIHVIDKASIPEAKSWEAHADMILLDSRDPHTGKVGGTGLIHDWGISKEIVKQIQKPVILAGGLSPVNVRQAIKTTKPYGVDINSGVQDADGFKDQQKLKLFIYRAKLA